MEMFDLDLDKTEDDIANPRSDFGDEAEEIRMGESLIKRQDYPVLVKLHTSLADWFTLVDGHRRCRAARRAGMKTLKAILVEKGVTEAEIRLIQLRTDFHKKHLSSFERSVVLLKLEAENPGTVKQLAAMVDMEESLVWRYIQIKKLGPEAHEAYKAGLLSLSAMVEVAKLEPEDQPAMLSVKGGRTEIARERKSRTKNAAPSVRAAKIKCPLVSGAVVTVSGDAISLEEAIEAVKEAAKAMTKARDQGLDAKTFQAVMKDLAAAS